MATVRVITDSACDLTDEMVSASNVIVVPLTIRFGNEELLDRRDITPTEFWRRCAEGGALPETAAPAPGAFQQAFAQAVDEGADAIVCLTLSAGVSATYQSARTAAEGFEPVPVEVVDTQALTMGQGLLVLAAAADAGGGVGLDDIAAATRERMVRTRTYGTLGTLDHLQRGGRIGNARALLGSLLSIKPVVQVKDGVVEEESKQRTRSRSVEYLANKVKADAPLEYLAVIDGAADDIGTLVGELEGVEVDHPVVRAELGPVVGTHTGPGTVGVCYLVR